MWLYHCIDGRSVTSGDYIHLLLWSHGRQTFTGDRISVFRYLFVTSHCKLLFWSLNFITCSHRRVLSKYFTPKSKERVKWVNIEDLLCTLKVVRDNFVLFIFKVAASFTVLETQPARFVLSQMWVYLSCSVMIYRRWSKLVNRVKNFIYRRIKCAYCKIMQKRVWMLTSTFVKKVCLILCES